MLKTDSPVPAAPAAAIPVPGEPAVRQGHRESVETFVIVFLGFLTWSLEAEGFVIPTGSMAPTLMGRHKEVTCPQCAHVYTVNADREVDNSGKGLVAHARISVGTCENCRFETSVRDLPSRSGDRVYVAKAGVGLPFMPVDREIRLKRWDVAVFKLPEEPEVRYIKRLVGMPDEVIRITGGDLWVKRAQSADFVPSYRPFAHQQAMQVTVWDDSHRPKSLVELPQWQRWASKTSGEWSEPAPGTYEASESGTGWKELRYRHLVPRPSDWAAVNAGTALSPDPRPTLITDFLSYNTDATDDDQEHPFRASRAWFQPHWVGDLTLSLKLNLRQTVGKLRLELVRSGVPNRCEIDLSTGEATLFHAGIQLGSPAPTGISAPGSYNLVFANVDGRLTIEVNSQLPFGDGLPYTDNGMPLVPTLEDLEPARVAVSQTSLEIQSLVLKRDLYYTLNPSQPDFTDFRQSERLVSNDLFDLLADPDRYARLTADLPREFSIRPGHYFMLGDNSPWSRDGRAWGTADQVDPDFPGRGWDDSGRESWEVPERLLIGKAFCVYWPRPHSVAVWPSNPFGLDTNLPFFPYIERMRWIR
jgi:signal peptidase I